MGWVGLGWVGLGWVGLGWVGLGWVGRLPGCPCLASDGSLRPDAMLMVSVSTSIRSPDPSNDLNLPGFHETAPGLPTVFLDIFPSASCLLGVLQEGSRTETRRVHVNGAVRKYMSSIYVFG